ncbi:hypothetical protein TNCV_4211221 [Trichonephila clavipes]|nr:hypothetical protein TNCV_4211221 [Trichonephila clavipes]
MPIHSPTLTNHKPGFEPLKDELFTTSHFNSVSNSRHQFATPSLHVPTANQVACSPPRTATFTGNIYSYDMGRRLAWRAICSAKSSDGFIF